MSEGRSAIGYVVLKEWLYSIGRRENLIGARVVRMKDTGGKRESGGDNEGRYRRIITPASFLICLTVRISGLVCESTRLPSCGSIMYLRPYADNAPNPAPFAISIVC